MLLRPYPFQIAPKQQLFFKIKQFKVSTGGDTTALIVNTASDTNTADNYTYVVSGKTSILRFDQGGFKFLSAPTGNACNAITFTGAMTILQNGNVGISNSTPTEKLSVTGNICATGTITASQGGCG